MRFNSGSREIRVFTISPRTRDVQKYWRDIKETIRWSEAYGCSGILIFTGNDTYIEPWLIANHALAETKNLSPLVAVNPVYMHPFAAAKMVSSLTLLFNRRIFLNMVIGTAVSHQEALGDELSHDERYARLAEYIEIIQNVLMDTNPVNFAGQYYQVSNLQLFPATPESLAPEFFLAGQSEAAHRICRTLGALSMQMLPPELAAGAKGRGIHFGVVTRSSSKEARSAACLLFQEDYELQEILDISMANTDAVWKEKLRRQSADPKMQESGYWMGPFRNFKADCPYFIGGYEEVSSLIAGLVGAGVDTFILDVPAKEEEYVHLNAAFSMAELRVRGAARRAGAHG